MRTFTFTHPHRRAHFNHFRAMANPHFGVTVDVDVTELRRVARASPTLRFTPAVVYLVTRAALEVRPLRWRIRGEEIVEHGNLRPSWAVPTQVKGAFSFCTVTYDADPVAFHAAAVEETARMQEQPSFEDEPGADDYLFLSSFPWATFTSITHAMPGPPGDSVPRLVWGKHYERDGKTWMPLAVQAHHAVVDGSDLGAYYGVMKRLLGEVDKIFSDFL